MTQLNKSIIESLDILQEIMTADEPVGSRELSRRLDMEHTRVNRIVKSLCVTGMVRQDETRKYVPGAAVHVLSAHALRGSSLLPKALPGLRKLKDKRHTVALGVLWKDSVCYILHSRPHQTLEEGIGSHDLFPAGRSSLGILLLSQSKGSPAGADPELIKNIEFALKNGYSRLVFTGGEVSLAVPVGNPVYAAVGTSIKNPTRGEEKKALQSILKIKDDIENSDLI